MHQGADRMRERWLAPGLIALILLGLDRWTKLMVIQLLPQGATLEVIPGFFNIVHVRNTGGAFGVASGTRSSFLFLLASIIAILVVISLIRKLPKEARMMRWSLGAVLGGGVGNLIDRVFYGRVIDFVDFYIHSLHWPAFNIADSSILVGLTFTLWGYLKQKKR